MKGTREVTVSKQYSKPLLAALRPMALDTIAQEASQLYSISVENGQNSDATGLAMGFKLGRDKELENARIAYKKQTTDDSLKDELVDASYLAKVCRLGSGTSKHAALMLFSKTISWEANNPSWFSLNYKVIMHDAVQQAIELRLNRTEIIKAAELEYKKDMSNGHYKWAAYVADAADLGRRRVLHAANAYIKELRSGDRHDAFAVAHELKLGGRRIKTAAIRIYNYYIGENNYYLAVFWAKEGRLSRENRIKAAKKWYNQELREGRREQAASLAVEYGLGRRAVVVPANVIYYAHIMKREYSKATDIAVKFKLGKTMIESAASKDYEGNMKQGNYLRAADIALKYNLGRHRITKSAELAYAGSFDQKGYPLSTSLRDEEYLAENIAKKFELGDEKIFSAGTARYQKIIEEAKKSEPSESVYMYCEAAHTAKKCRLGDQLVKDAATMAYDLFLSDGNYVRAINIVTQFGLDEGKLVSVINAVKEKAEKEPTIQNRLDAIWMIKYLNPDPALSKRIKLLRDWIKSLRRYGPAPMVSHIEEIGAGHQSKNF